MVALVPGHDYTMNAKLGMSQDGRIVGLDASVVASGGAYPAIGAVLPLLTQMMVVGVYDIAKVRFSGTTVVTNTTPVGAYRGAGRPEATQLIERVIDVAADQLDIGLIERVIDVAADQLDIDPAEIRRRNFIDPAAFPAFDSHGRLLRFWGLRQGARRCPSRLLVTRSFTQNRPAAELMATRYIWVSGCQPSWRSQHRSVSIPNTAL